MNVIVSNLNGDKFSNLGVDVIKSISGEFTSEEIVQSFSNFFFNRMFLDVTAIKDYNNINNIQKLSIGLDVSKIILYLGDDPAVNNSAYISRLISMGVYNFAREESEIMYLYNNPNQYKDVARLQTLDDDLVKVQDAMIDNNTHVIGFKDFTSHAGATSLIYMLHKQLSKNYYVVSIEVNKKDFMFFNDTNMVSITQNNLKDSILKYQKANIILVDLNDIVDSVAASICTDLIFLLEPSTLEINKISMININSFARLRDYKVVLNDCLLNDKDIKVFASEANINVFYSLPPMNDREDNSKILFPFLEKLGLYKRVNSDNTGNSNKFL